MNRDSRALQNTETQASTRPATGHVAILLPFVTQEPDVITDRQPGVAEQALHKSLVHSRRARKHAAADIWNVGHLKQSLDRAVLTVCSVQHRKDSIERSRQGQDGKTAGRSSGMPCSGCLAQVLEKYLLYLGNCNRLGGSASARPA